MSKQLGQIHYWLYHKIQLVLQREQRILEEAQETLGDLADELYATAVDLYGAPLDPSLELADIIDHGQIHGWLQKEIRTATVREASFIKDLVDCGGDEAFDAVLRAFEGQGTACGFVARKALPELTAPAIYQVMQNFYLNGMPCDGGDTIRKDSPGEVEWDADFKHQRESWQAAGVNPAVMKQAYESWFKAFVHGVFSQANFIVDDTHHTYHIVIEALQDKE